jgi:TonB family protein
MITGFNSDIEYGGKVFHVQTEEKGLDNPVVITLVYCGGEIVTSIEASYADLIDEELTPEEEIRGRMSEQHQELIQGIRRGKFTPTQMPYGHDLISDRSLDELVLGYLEDEIVERTVRVGRVLHKLERFLTAAERAKLESEAPAEAAQVETPAEPTEVECPAEPVESEDVVEAVQATDVATATTEGRRRRTGWLWPAVAAAIIVGAAAWFTMGVEPTLPSPVVESNETSATQNDAPLASAAAVPAIPLLAEEPATETTSQEIPSSTAVPTPAPKPRREKRTEDRIPTPTVEPEAIPVEEAAAVTPEPSMAPVPAEPDPPAEVVEPVVLLDDVDVSPMAKQRDLPRYTRRARRLQQEGVVQLRVQIDPHGEVTEVVLLSGIPDSDLNEAAVDVAKGWSFSPARKNGQRVGVFKDVAFEFTVRPDRTTSVRIRE